MAFDRQYLHMTAMCEPGMHDTDRFLACPADEDQYMQGSGRTGTESEKNKKDGSRKKKSSRAGEGQRAPQADSPVMVVGKYKKLLFSLSQKTGGKDADGYAVGPVMVASITGWGYHDSFPSKLDIMGILESLGFNVESLDVLKPSQVIKRNDGAPYVNGYGDIFLYEQPMFPVPSGTASDKAAG